MSFVYDSDNTVDNERRKFQPDHNGDVAVNVKGQVSLDPDSLIELENITVTVDNEVEIKNDSGNPVPVTGTDLDIRDLSFSQDKVDVSGSTVGLDAASLAALENITVTVSNEVEIKNDVGSPVPVSGPLTDAELRAARVPIINVDTTNGSAVTLIKGASTGTNIGNVSDSLKVNITNSVGTSGLVNDGTVWSAAAVINAASSDVDNPLMYIRNPVGSGKDFYFWRGRMAMLITNNSLRLKIWINATHSAVGALLPAVNRNVGGTNPASVVLVTTVPTITSYGTLLTAAGIGQNSNSIDINEDFAIRLAPGNNMLITGDPSSNNRATAVTVVWQERAP